MVKLVLITFHLFNIIHVNLLKGGNDMNVHMIRVKHIETNFRQKNLNNAFGITEKVMCHKECSEENNFKAIEMLTLVDELDLLFAEFNAIFNFNLPNV